MWLEKFAQQALRFCILNLSEFISGYALTLSDVQGQCNIAGVISVTSVRSPRVITSRIGQIPAMRVMPWKEGASFPFSCQSSGTGLELATILVPAKNYFSQNCCLKQVASVNVTDP